MPELPEVETVRRTLADRVRGCTVSGVIVRRRDVIVTPDDPAGGFSRQRRTPAERGTRDERRIRRSRSPRRVEKSDLLLDDQISDIRRHGKQLALVGESGRCVLIHLGMTGEVMAPGPGQRLRAADHLHVLWTLRQPGGDSAGRMVFRDPRRFGGIWTLPTPQALADRWAQLGPDGLTITGEGLARGAGRSRRAVKAALLDQRTVAGVGNIYADESLFRSGIAPQRLASGLSASDWERLAGAIREILSQAVELRGSTLRDYRDAGGLPGDATSLHQVYGRSGRSCNRCETPLSDELVAQRTTVWCPRCQPAENG
ncbi:MAG: DNA-formamidopyrimidine glycosylase family protein [Planctomycetota bacterium]